MNKEELKILNIIDCWKNGDYVLAYSFDYYRAGKQNELLLKYITNLQQENKQLREQLDVHKILLQTNAPSICILTELEECLKEKFEAIRTLKEMLGEDVKILNPNIKGIEIGYKVIQDKIQELKEKYK